MADIPEEQQDHEVAIELTENLTVTTIMRFAEPGSGIIHDQELMSYIPQGTVIRGRAKFKLV